MGAAYAKRAVFWLSAETLIVNETYKIVTAQPSPDLMEAASVNDGWKNASGDWSADPGGCGTAYQNRTAFKPCVFDVVADPSERHDLGDAALTRELWGLLNRSNLSVYSSRSPAASLGYCNATCASALWSQLGSVNQSGPSCGVAECGATPDGV